LNTEIATHQRTQPAVALEAVFIRDEIRAAVALPPAEGEITALALWVQESARIGPLLELIPASQAPPRPGILQEIIDRQAGPTPSSAPSTMFPPSWPAKSPTP
jgi:hypothetical protein